MMQPHFLLENEWESQKLLRTIEIVPEKCKKMCSKKQIRGLEHGEIAAANGISHRTGSTTTLQVPETYEAPFKE